MKHANEVNQVDAWKTVNEEKMNKKSSKIMMTQFENDGLKYISPLPLSFCQAYPLLETSVIL